VNYIALAIPVFFLLIGVELVFTRLLERDSYRLSDSVGDLSCGLLQQVTEVFLKTSVFAAYVFVYESWRRFEIPASALWAWIFCYLGYDLLYYWYHRLSHEVNAGWASHVVHHQSEEYNLTVALRQSAIPVSWVFYLPLALIGFPPQMFLVVSAIDTLYQFWIHTRLVGRLGPLEWVLNTPSHHRVHHGRNPRYIDRNHGGTLIVWDRLFGTFAEEREEPVYGITKPLASFNPLWANLHYWVEMWDVARQTARPLDRLRVLWARPGWRPADLGGPLLPPEVDRSSYVKFDVPLAGSRRLYVLAQLVLVLLAATPYLLRSGSLGVPERVLGAALIAWSVVSFGALLDGRPWAAPLENARLAALALGALLVPGPALARGGLVLLACASVVWLNREPQKTLPLAPELR
jgi:sterol desaturase/sphingolipid hydroxylase (fatty acid hydroxylase superfamily)